MIIVLSLGYWFSVITEMIYAGCKYIFYFICYGIEYAASEVMDFEFEF